MSTHSRPRSPWPTPLAPSLVAGVLWLLVAGVRWAFMQIADGFSQVGALVPDIVPLTVWQWPDPWPAVAVAMGALAVAACSMLYASLAGRANGRDGVIVGTWFATVAAGATVGLALDIAVTWDALAAHGPRGLLVGEFGGAAAAGALWGLATGWAPGLVAARAATGAAEAADAAEVTERRRPTWPLAVAAVTVIAVIAGGIAGADAQRADIAAQAEAQRQAEAETSFGAPPDPGAQGQPVPEAAASSGALDAQWCTADRATLLKGEPDAATGHRALAITLMNFSESPCVIEGYPDVAFGDQNSHLLAAEVEPGSSFMTRDPGPQRIEIPAGGSAISYLGWDAASPHGALVTKTVYAAPTAGMTRGSWPIDLDIVEGSTVSITAWQLVTAAPAA